MSRPYELPKNLHPLPRPLMRDAHLMETSVRSETVYRGDFLS